MTVAFDLTAIFIKLMETTVYAGGNAVGIAVAGYFVSKALGKLDKKNGKDKKDGEK